MSKNKMPYEKKVEIVEAYLMGAEDARRVSRRRTIANPHFAVGVYCTKKTVQRRYSRQARTMTIQQTLS